VPSNSQERLGDSIAWGGCTIIYLLGQQLHFELFDFSYQILNIAEVEAVSVMQTHKNSQFAVQVYFTSSNHPKEYLLGLHNQCLLIKLLLSLLSTLHANIIELFSVLLNYLFFFIAFLENCMFFQFTNTMIKIISTSVSSC